jgi:hypothetical protein
MLVKIDMFVLLRGEASVAEAKNKGLKEFLCCLWLMVMRIEMTKRMVKTVKNHKI